MNDRMDVQITDTEIGEAIEVLARDLSYQFPVGVREAYEQLVGLYRGLEMHIELAAARGETIQVALQSFIIAATKGENHGQSDT